MSPDRLKAWVKKRKAGATQLVLAHEQGLGIRGVVATWTREELEEAEDPGRGGADVVAALLDAMQDHTDGVNGGRCTYLLMWQSSGGHVLSSTPMYCEPSAASAATQTSDTAVSTQSLIRDLLGHIHNQQKVMNGSIGVVLNGQKTTIESLQATNALIFAQNVELRRGHALAAHNPPPGPEELETHRLKQEALKKLIDFAPGVLMLAVKAVAAHFDVDLPSNSNGADKAGEHDAH